MNDDYSLRSRATYARTPQLVSKTLTLFALATVVAVLTTPLSVQVSAQLAAAEAETTQVDVWWPTDGATVSGVQPFKALVPGHALDQYVMYWSVDGGARTPMHDSYQDYPHKEATVDLSGWQWRGSGPYEVTFTAVGHDNRTIAEQRVRLALDALTDTVPTAVEQEAAAPESPSASVQVWWPTDGTTVSGVQPFKAALASQSVDTYTMFWSVDGGAHNEMQTSQTDGPHKESLVDLSRWDWRGSGPYAVTFTAFGPSGATLAETTVHITTGGTNTAAVSTAPTETLAPLESVVARTVTDDTQSTVAVANSGDFYRNPDSPAARQADAWRTSRPYEASLMDVLAAAPTAQWLGGWNTDVQADVARTADAANAAGERAVFVAYNIPGRDCGSYSAGGVASGDAYRSWIRSIAGGLHGNNAIVILEPDALAGMDCLSGAAQEDRISLVREATETLAAAGAVVYIDAGHSHWQSAATMADRLQRAGIDRAAGFALNVSNYYHTTDAADYGRALSDQLGGAHFIIDTSRNGQGPKGSEWCNPSGRGIGELPTTNTGDDRIDAYLWVKTPGESDGTCNGGPSAGSWWPEYAVGLVERRAQ